MTRLEKLLVLHEGLVLKKYRCPAGKLTVGVGHNLDANPIPGLPDEIDKDTALQILKDDLAEVNEALELNVPCWTALDAVRAAVLTDMAFNLGIYGLLKFKNTLKAFEDGRWDDAAKAMALSRWATQVGKRSARLAQMVRTGEWPDLSTIPS